MDNQEIEALYKIIIPIILGTVAVSWFSTWCSMTADKLEDRRIRRDKEGW